MHSVQQKLTIDITAVNADDHTFVKSSNGEKYTRHLASAIWPESLAKFY